jgi:hypothetical protein
MSRLYQGFEYLNSILLHVEAHKFKHDKSPTYIFFVCLKSKHDISHLYYVCLFQPFSCAHDHAILWITTYKAIFMCPRYIMDCEL